MTLVRATRPPRCLRTLSQARQRHAQLSARTLSSTAIRRGGDAHGHGDKYDPPTGWLFGVPPGEKYKKEGWENIFLYGFWGSLIFGLVGYQFKSDSSIQTWALEEARRRLEAEGILTEESTK